MTRDRILSVIFALFVSALGLWAALRWTEPHGHTPTRQELERRAVADEMDYEGDLAREGKRYLEKARAVKPGDFRSHIEAAAAYARILRTRRLRDTNGASGTFAPDLQLRRILAECRPLATAEHDRKLIAQIEAGERAGIPPSAP